MDFSLILLLISTGVALIGAGIIATEGLLYLIFNIEGSLIVENIGLGTLLTGGVFLFASLLIVLIRVSLSPENFGIIT